ncbi:AraC family transcriptional regulator [Paenibacillus sp. Y412MC10]|uniref:helix-turn-helix transcriptional regulator n=1 Tax=Geobacillus sp. (strain Y412MC10) TaxID=481743 RepID=UPI0021B33738|nr:AraC family transcriptional regulator [Paenibacillus sp. Y412MC10]
MLTLGNRVKSFVVSMERFKPHTFQASQGEGLFMSHSHEYDELTLILEGDGYYSSSEQNIKVAAGDLILIPSGLHHGFVCTKPWKGVSVHFLHDLLPVHCQYLFHEAESESQRIQSAHLDADDTRWVEISLFQLEKEWNSERKTIDSYNMMRIAFETALLVFQRNIESAVPGADIRHGVIEEVLKEIHSSYHTRITVNELAARHFLSESNLRKKFTESVGVSPKQYIISLRLMEAKRLLQQTSKAIDSIASEVGFTSSSRFYEFFIQSTGVTPLEWRKQNQ